MLFRSWEARQGSDMISIADVLQGIEEYKVEVGYKPARIAVTPDQMDAIKTDKVATQYLDHDKDGRVIIAGVRIEVWGRPEWARAQSSSKTPSFKTMQ